MLEQLFGSRTRIKLLRLLLGNPTKEFFVRELTRRTNEQINSVRRELANLETIDLLSSTDRDFKKYYRVNTAHILYPELRALILKSRLMLEQSFVRAIRDAGRMKLLLLTGQFVDHHESPVDILMVGQVNRGRLTPLLAKFKDNFGSELRFTVMSEGEYQFRKDITDKFLYSILNGPKVVVFDSLAGKAGPSTGGKSIIINA